MKIPSVKACRCTEDWLEMLCKRRVCSPLAAKRRGCTEGKFYPLPLARLLERAAYGAIEGWTGQRWEKWHKDWARQMEKEQRHE